MDLWIDASAGVAGDMLLGALLDAGASLDAVRGAVTAVVPDEVAVTTSTVTRAGLRALRADVQSRTPDHPHRSWADIRALLGSADLPEQVRTPALAVFGRLADAEGRVHGVPPIGQRSQHRTAHDVVVLDEQHRGHAKTLVPLASNG